MTYLYIRIRISYCGLIFEYTKEYPREYKYTLGQDMKRDTYL